MRKGKIRYTKVETFVYEVDLDGEPDNELNFYLGNNTYGEDAGPFVCTSMEDVLMLDQKVVKDDGDGFITAGEPTVSTAKWELLDPDGNVTKVDVIDNMAKQT